MISKSTKETSIRPIAELNHIADLNTITRIQITKSTANTTDEVVLQKKISMIFTTSICGIISISSG